MRFNSSRRIDSIRNQCLGVIGWLMMGWICLTPVPIESQSYHRDTLTINPKGCIWYAGLKDSTRILADTSWSLGAKDPTGKLFPPQPIIQSIMRSKPSRIPIPPGMNYISFHFTGNYYMTGDSNSTINKPDQNRDEGAHVWNLSGGNLQSKDQILQNIYFPYIVPDTNWYRNLNQDFPDSTVKFADFTRHGISGLDSVIWGCAVGVFLSQTQDYNPQGNPEINDTLDIFNRLTDYPLKLQQAFYIGESREFVPIPPGADTLYLGFALNRFDDPWSEDSLRGYLLFSSDSIDYGLFPRIGQPGNYSAERCHTRDTLFQLELSSRSLVRPIYDTVTAIRTLPDFLEWGGLSYGSLQPGAPLNAPDQALDRTDSLHLQFRHRGWRDTTYQGTVRLPYLQSTLKHLYYEHTYSPPNQDVLLTDTLAIVQPSLEPAWIDDSLYDTLRVPFTVHTLGLIIPEKELHFGSVLVNQSEIRELVIYNTCHEFLTIDSLGFLDPKGTSVFRPVQPAGSYAIFPDSTLRIPISFSPIDSGYCEDWLILYNKDRRDTLIVRLDGIGGRRDIEVTPESIDIDSICYPDTFKSVFTIRNTGNLPLQLDSLSETGLARNLKLVSHSPVLPVSIKSMESVQLSLELVLITSTPRSPMPDIIMLYSNAGNTPNQPLPITIAKVEVPKPELMTSFHDFGSIEVGKETGFGECLIRNQGCDKVRINNWYFTGQDQAFILTTPADSMQSPFYEKKYFAVTFKPLKNGSMIDTLIIEYDSVSGGRDTMVMEGKGISPELSIDTAQLHIGDSTLCNHVPVIDWLDITNTGTAGLRIYRIELDEDSPISFEISRGDTLHFTTIIQDTVLLTAGGHIKLKLYIRYTPPGIGSDSARLIFHTNHYYHPVDTYWIRTDSVRSQNILVTHSDGLSESDTLRFAQGGIGNRVYQTIKIDNPGCYPLTIDRMMTHDPFYLDTSQLGRTFPLAVEPGGSLDVPLYFLPMDTSLHIESFRIYSDDPLAGRNPVTITMRGSSGYPVMGISSPVVMFDSVCIRNDSDFQILTINNNGSIPLWLDSVVSRYPQVFRVDYQPVDSIPPGQSGAIGLVFKPHSHPDSIKVYTTTLLIFSNDPGSPDTCTLIGRSHGQRMDIITDTVEFTLQDLGVASPAEGRLANPGCYPLTIVSLQSNHPYFTWQTPLPTEIEAGAEDTIPLSFLPTATQDTGKIIRAVLTLNGNDPYQPQQRIVMQARVGYALSSYATRSLDFDSTCIEDSSDMNLNLINRGIVPLVIDSFRWLDGTVFTHHPPDSMTLNPLAELAVILTSRPVQIGDWQDRLVIYSNSISSPDTIRVRVPAKGQSFHLPVTRIEFEEFSIVKDNTHTAELQNIGCYPLEISELIIRDTSNFNFTLSPNLPFTIQPGAIYTTPSIRYHPDSIEQSSTYLIITTNDPRRERDSILLTGSVTRDEFQRVRVYPLVCTPNEDGFNEQIDFNFLDNAYPRSEVLIFDKNGKQVRHLTHYPFFWRGRDENNKLVAPGVYLYFIKAPEAGVYQKGSVLVVY